VRGWLGCFWIRIKRKEEGRSRKDPKIRGVLHDSFSREGGGRKNGRGLKNSQKTGDIKGALWIQKDTIENRHAIGGRVDHPAGREKKPQVTLGARTVPSGRGTATRSMVTKDTRWYVWKKEALRESTIIPF